MKAISILIPLILISLVTAGNYQLPTSNATGMITFANETKLNFGAFNHAGAVKYLLYNVADNNFYIAGDPVFSDGAKWTGNLVPTSGSDIVATGSTSDIDYSLSSGVWKSPTGIFTMTNGCTVPTGKTIAVTDADRITENGVIVPQIIPIKYTFDQASVNRSIAIMDGAYQVVEIDEVHSVAGGVGGRLEVLKVSGTQTPTLNTGGGVMCSTQKIDISNSSPVNTVQTSTPNTTATNYQFANHDRIAVCVGGTITGVVGEVTVWLKRI
jgi:hypothetical protein